jgi:hypothetical protein
MTVKSKNPDPVQPEDEQEAPQVDLAGRIFERPDGFYWQAEDREEQYGPFTTRAEAELDMQSGGNDLEPGESLQEAESELGISDWIDPDTGGPAEDSVPHIEDH